MLSLPEGQQHGALNVTRRAIATSDSQTMSLFPRRAVRQCIRTALRRVGDFITRKASSRRSEAVFCTLTVRTDGGPFVPKKALSAIGTLISSFAWRTVIRRLDSSLSSHEGQLMTGQRREFLPSLTDFFTGITMSRPEAHCGLMVDNQTALTR